jgi:ABC-type transporter Mla maintaining outer membrane lipid asymmetry permease subunit MlaE
MNARELARRVTEVGRLALPIVVLGAAGASAAWLAFAEGGSPALVRAAPGLVGPLAAVLLAAGPLGAAQAGEIGALRAGRQIEWLRAAGRSVFAQVVAARVLAVAIVLPLASGIAVATCLAATAIDTAWRHTGALPLARLALADVAAGAERAALGGAVLGAVACATGLVSRASVARTAARGAIACLSVAAAFAFALLAGPRG